MKKYIIIKADTNDADYTSSKNLITDEDIEAIKPVIKQLKARQKLKAKNHNKYLHNWEHGEYSGRMSPYALYVETGLLTEEQVELFNEYIPYGEHGIHSIVSVEILTVSNEEKLL